MVRYEEDYDGREIASAECDVCGKYIHGDIAYRPVGGYGCYCEKCTSLDSRQFEAFDWLEEDQEIKESARAAYDDYLCDCARDDALLAAYL